MSKNNVDILFFLCYNYKKGAKMSSNNEIIVKKPEEVITARMKLNESELKLSTYLIANLEPDKYIYKIDIKNYIKKFDKKLGDYSKLYKTAKFLVTKPIEIKDRYKDEFVMFSFCSKVSYKSGVLEIEFNKELLNYLLEIKNKYVRYDIKNIMKLNSKYSIRLYEFLKNQFEKTKKFSKVAEKKVKTEELRELLAIPASYKYNMFKKTALEVSKRQINQLTDISFDYEEIKTGRKITHIKFTIKSKEKESEKKVSKLSQENNTETETKNQLPAPTNNNDKLEQLKERLKNARNLNELRKLLLNFGESLILIYFDEYYHINEVTGGYLKNFFEEGIYEANESAVIWGNIFDNRKNIEIYLRKEFNIDEFRLRVKKEKLAKFVESVEKLNKEYNIFPLLLSHPRVTIEGSMDDIYAIDIGRDFKVYEEWEKEKKEELINNGNFLFIVQKFGGNKKYYISYNKNEFLTDAEKKIKEMQKQVEGNK